MLNRSDGDALRASISRGKKFHDDMDSFSWPNGPSNRNKDFSKRKIDKFHCSDLEWTDEIPECPVYHPSEGEFEDPLVYLQKISPEASRYGQGITEPMLYIGMLFSIFAWRMWRMVSCIDDAALRFENVVKENVYREDILSANGEYGAFDVLSGKTALFPPNILLKSIPCWL